VKRLRRILLNALTALSLILFAATVGLWIESYGQRPGVYGVGLHSPSWYGQAMSFRGTLLISHVRGSGYTAMRASNWPAARDGLHLVRRGAYGAGVIGGGSGGRAADAPPVPGNMAFTGVSLGGEKGMGNPAVRVRVITIGIPYWVAALVFGGVVSWSLWLARRRHHTPGVCAHCGYDLRATPDRCPECGTIPAR
jgi:hypothetical protein